LPASLKVILAEAGSDRAAGGGLTPWARQGVLLLNSALTVEAGKAGAHLRYGWAALTDATRHGVFESGHPSPLNRARDFPGPDPFGRANQWLATRGCRPIDWRLG
ncbi:uracil-DNA glycosylase, partial [Methylobacterium sp. C33D]